MRAGTLDARGLRKRGLTDLAHDAVRHRSVVEVGACAPFNDERDSRWIR
jgi:hypothetical protein